MIFRKVNGHIIPIVDKHKEKAQGAGIAAAGVGVGASGGYVASRLTRDAAHFENMARKTAKEARAAQKVNNAKLFKAKSRGALNNAIEGIKHQRAAIGVRTAATAIGASLIGGGVHRALSKTDLKEPQKAAIATTAGVGAGVAAHTVFNKTLGAISWKKAFKTTVKKIVVKKFAK